MKRLTLSYIEMLRGVNTGRDRKKLKNCYTTIQNQSKNDFENKSMKKMIKLICLMRQKLDVSPLPGVRRTTRYQAIDEKGGRKCIM